MTPTGEEVFAKLEKLKSKFYEIKNSIKEEEKDD